jgi:hypothetical protein
MLLCQLSQAQGSCGTRRWIALDFSATDWPSTFRDTVLADLKASLGERKIDVCQVPTPTTPPIARITLTSPKPLTAGIVVVAADEAATKRASRTITLDNVPADGRAFAVALATDELLSASWDELALIVPEPPQAPEPRESVSVPIVRTEGSSLPDNRLGLFGLIDAFVGGQRGAGAELQYGHRIGKGSPWSLRLAFGALLGQTVRTSNGSITSQAWTGGGWLHYAWLESHAISLGAAVGSRFGRHTFIGHGPADGASDSSAVETSTAHDWVYSFGVRGDARIALSDAVGLDLALDVGQPISGVEITDTQQVVTGTTGLRLTPSVGVVAQW